ncbi:nucleotide exchange factor GrpE [Planctomycetota bacterium]
MKKKRKEDSKTQNSDESEHMPKYKDKELEKLNDALETLQQEKEELFGKLQRVSADYANYQKRTPKQIADTILYEKEKIIKTLLPVLDNLKHTLQNANTAEDTDALSKGVRIIYDQMLDILKSHGVEKIEALGEKFDPAQHEAMMQMAEPEEQDNVVLQEFQKGFKLNGRVIRPAKVVVNKLRLEKSSQEPRKEDFSEEISENSEKDVKIIIPDDFESEDEL